MGRAEQRAAQNANRMSQTDMVSALNFENRALRNKIRKLEEAQINADFIEKLTAAALTGASARSDMTPDKAGDFALAASEYVFNKIVQAAREADKAGHAGPPVEGEEAPPTEPESKLIVAP